MVKLMTVRGAVQSGLWPIGATVQRWLLVVTCAVVVLLRWGVAVEAEVQLEPVPFENVEIDDAFWSQRLATHHETTMPHALEKSESTGRVANFAVAGGLQEGEFQGKYFNDSDLYKVLEGAAYTYALKPDPQFKAKIDKIIDKVAAAQQPDGYVNTYHALVQPEKRWTHLTEMHELYCAGHLIEAGVAYDEATGDDNLLQVARGMADHIDDLFGPNKRKGYSGHQEIELALLRLYEHTGETRYLDLARFFLDQRGRFKLKHDDNPPHRQAHKPIVEQTEAVGHAVRATYQYAAIAALGWMADEATYRSPIQQVWDDVVLRKMYVTGGAGSREDGQAFGDAYELPNCTSYCETCASIGMAFWAHYMWLDTDDARYLDVLERQLYNGVLVGVSLEGDKFFYENRLCSHGDFHRQPWFSTACCPSNITRFIPQIGRYIYATEAGDDGGKTVYVNQLIGSSADITVGDTRLKLRQESKLPWSGEIGLVVESVEGDRSFTLKCRVPSWCESQSIKTSWQGAPQVEKQGGYWSVTREWKTGDRIDLSIPLAVRKVRSNPQVIPNRGRVALERGPIVYCVEAVDNGGAVHDLVLPANVEFATRFDSNLLQGVTVLEADGRRAERVSWDDELYQPIEVLKPARVTAVPYYAWDNREPGSMTVWIPQSPGLPVE